MADSIYDDPLYDETLYDESEDTPIGGTPATIQAKLCPVLKKGWFTNVDELEAIV